LPRIDAPEAIPEDVFDASRMQYSNQKTTLEFTASRSPLIWKDESSAPAEMRLGPTAILIRPLGPGISREEAAAIVGLIATELRDRRTPPKRLLVDLSTVSIPSSMAIGLLLELARLAEERGSVPHLHAPRKMLEVLRMLQLDGRYTMVVSERRLAELLR
jgi:anti-anti-sigma regulatory factor